MSEINHTKESDIIKMIIAKNREIIAARKKKHARGGAACR